MKKIKELIAGSRGFVGEVQTELKKCSWPTRPELLESTVVVIVSVVILGVFVGVSDMVLMTVLRVLIH